MHLAIYMMTDTSLANLHFSLASQRERETIQVKGLTIAMRINLNQNNRSVSELFYLIIRKTCPILPLLVGIMVGRQTGRQVGSRAAGQAGKLAC